jgi:hypothetical protein
VCCCTGGLTWHSGTCTLAQWPHACTGTVAGRVQPSYDQKADMYSLGIILFEMWHPPFETTMDRITTIVKLRDRMVRCPAVDGRVVSRLQPPR